ncbi:hypothetical protein Gogos_009193, partial [Gossypium gossypioides]|nr:hypothetical protein [Gossypium gossypioides]
SIANSLGRLQTLKIWDCSQLEEIIQGSEVSDINLQSFREVEPWEIANFEDMRLLPIERIIQGSKVSNISLQSLREVEVRNCNNLMYLFPMSIANSLRRLQTLQISDCSQLEEIIQGSEVSNISLQSLREVKVENCNNLRYLFPMSFANSLGGLQTLEGCFGLEEIIKAKKESNICLYSLMEVFVRECNMLTSLSSLSHGRILKSLTKLEIYDCLQLEDTFPITMAQGLPLLNEVVLEDLPQFKGRDGNEIVLTLSSLQKLKVVN